MRQVLRTAVLTVALLNFADLIVGYAIGIMNAGATMDVIQIRHERIDDD